MIVVKCLDDYEVEIFSAKKVALEGGIVKRMLRQAVLFSILGLRIATTRTSNGIDRFD